MPVHTPYYIWYICLPMHTMLVFNAFAPAGRSLSLCFRFRGVAPGYAFIGLSARKIRHTISNSFISLRNSDASN